MMHVQIEFLGLARLVTGEKELALEVKEGTTFRDLVRMLAEKYPQMIGNVIRPDRATLQEPNIFNLNAKRMIQSKQMDDAPEENDRIILMSMSAGG
jgi:molybdopterin converting factor small subunit